ncbi:hypothetical protein FQZ97_1248380 [compost metagenome]
MLMQRLAGGRQVIGIQHRAMLADEYHCIVFGKSQGSDTPHPLPQVTHWLAHDHPVVVFGQGFQGLVRPILDPEDPLTEAQWRKVEYACH